MSQRHSIAAAAAVIGLSMPAGASAQTEAVVLKRLAAGSTTLDVVADTSGRGSLEIRDKELGVNDTIDLKEHLRSVTAIGTSADRKHIGLIVDAEGVPTIIVVDRPSGAVISDFPVLTASMSPGGSFIAFEQFRNRTEADVSARYGLIDLSTFRGGGSLRRPLDTFFPHDSVQHFRQSELQWVSRDTLGFLDMAGNSTFVVVARFGPRGVVERLQAKALDTEDLVVTSAVDGSGPPATAIYGALITRLDEPGLVLRLRFPENPALKVRRVDIRLWD